MRYIVFILLLLPVTVFSQRECDSLPWSAVKKLAVSDFKDVADTGRRMIAFTQSKFSYHAAPQDDGVVITTAAYFFPCSSWLNRANVKTSIAHEQLHFDITEYFRRLFLKRVKETKTTEDMFSTTTRAIFRDIADQRRAMHELYDKETGNGQEVQEQVRWSRKVADMLAELTLYSNASLTVNLK